MDYTAVDGYAGHVVVGTEGVRESGGELSGERGEDVGREAWAMVKESAKVLGNTDERQSLRGIVVEHSDKKLTIFPMNASGGHTDDAADIDCLAVVQTSS